MQLHGDIAIKISRIFKKYKFLHSLFKKIYFKMNYFLYADKNFKYKIENGKLYELPIKSKKDFFFGYYHNTPWSYDDKFIIVHSIIDSEKININILNIQESKIQIIDDTILWNFQQGPMSGWIPQKHIIYYNRCDLHPRWNNKGTHIMIDSSCSNRRMPLIINLEGVLNNGK